MYNVLAVIIHWNLHFLSGLKLFALTNFLISLWAPNLSIALPMTHQPGFHEHPPLTHFDEVVLMQTLMILLSHAKKLRLLALVMGLTLVLGNWLPKLLQKN